MLDSFWQGPHPLLPLDPAAPVVVQTLGGDLWLWSQVGFNPSPATCQQWEPKQFPPGASVSSSGKWGDDACPTRWREVTHVKSWHMGWHVGLTPQMVLAVI